MAAADIPGLLREYLPNAPDLGLFVAPDIPGTKLRAAIGDYAPEVASGEVLALYDATRLGSAKDGALFLTDRFVFQNNDLQTPRAVRYEDIVGVRTKRQLLGGKRVELEVNRGRATITETLDFSAQAGAAEFVERFLRETMLRGGSSSPAASGGTTDRDAVAATLETLVRQGLLTAGDRQRMLDSLG